MPIIVAEQSALEAYLAECLTLTNQINQTLTMIANAEASFIADGFKKPNIKALVAGIKKLNKPIEEVFFKNTAGTISISPTQVDAALDTNIRLKLHNLVTKEITATAVEKTKSDLLKAKVAISKNYSIPAAAFKKMLEVYSRDSTAFIKDGSLMMSISDGFKLDQI